MPLFVACQSDVTQGQELGQCVDVSSSGPASSQDGGLHELPPAPVYDDIFLLDYHGDDPNSWAQGKELFTDVSSELISPAGREDVLHIYADIQNFQVFDTPLSPDGRSVSVTSDCVKGVCQCKNYLEGMAYQLKPCRFGALMCTANGFRDPQFADLFYAIIDGFPVVESLDIPEYECDNYLSILSPEAKPKMDEIIKSELDEGMVTVRVTKPHCVHALGAVCKPDGGIRPITDCSRPPDIAVNNFSSSLLEPFHYMSVNDVTKDLSRYDFMSVVDIKSAYRAVPIKPEHRTFVGFKWDLDGEDRFFHDNRLCFGLRTGPYQFNKISSFIAETLHELHGITIVQYLDDFFCSGHSFASCEWAQNSIIRLLRYLGFYVSWKKVSPPSQITTYLGIEIDSIAMELRLPEGKLQKMRSLLSQVNGLNHIDRKSLERLTGYLAHCSTIIRGGRLFCRRLYDLYKVMHSKNLKRIRIPAATKADIIWWHDFAEQFNGKAAIANPECEFPMYSDSSFSGYGACMAGDWVLGTWSHSDSIDTDNRCGHIGPQPSLPDEESSNINTLEMWPVLVGLRRWASYFTGKSVTLYIDNTQVKCMIANSSSSNKTCMEWLRQIFWLCIDHNIQLRTAYISSADNFLADSLSRAFGEKDIDYLRLSKETEHWCCSNYMLSLFDRWKRDTTPTTESTVDVSCPVD